jgi:hypothetical protein
MSDHVEGLVAKISEKAAGKGTVYNVCLEIEGQDDEWFGHGFDEPEFFEGDFIEFDIEWNGEYANFDKSTINVLEEGDGAKKPSRKPARSSGRSSGGRGNAKSSGRSSGGRSSGGGSSRGKPAASKGRGKPAAKGNADAMSKDEWADKDRMIRRQACMNTAINLVKLLNEAGVLPAIKKKSEGVDSLIALCDEEAERLYDQYEEQVYGGGTAKRGSKRNAREDYDDDIPE